MPATVNDRSGWNAAVDALEEMAKAMGEKADAARSPNPFDPATMEEADAATSGWVLAQAAKLLRERTPALSSVAVEEADAEAVGWRPIETAPRDGTHALFFWPNIPKSALSMGASLQVHHGISIGWFEYDEDWSERPEGWVSPECGFRMEGDEALAANQEDCRFWQPLPTPPVSTIPSEPKAKREAGAEPVGDPSEGPIATRRDGDRA